MTLADNGSPLTLSRILICFFWSSWRVSPSRFVNHDKCERGLAISPDFPVPRGYHPESTALSLLCIFKVPESRTFRARSRYYCVGSRVPLPGMVVDTIDSAEHWSLQLSASRAQLLGSALFFPLFLSSSHSYYTIQTLSHAVSSIHGLANAARQISPASRFINQSPTFWFSNSWHGHPAIRHRLIPAVLLPPPSFEVNAIYLVLIRRT